MSGRDFFVRLGINYDEKPTMCGIPAEEYREKCAEYVSSEDWQSLADLMGLQLTPKLVRSFKHFQ